MQLNITHAMSCDWLFHESARKKQPHAMTCLSLECGVEDVFPEAILEMFGSFLVTMQSQIRMPHQTQSFASSSCLLLTLLWSG